MADLQQHPQQRREIKITKLFRAFGKLRGHLQAFGKDWRVCICILLPSGFRLAADRVDFGCWASASADFYGWRASGQAQNAPCPWPENGRQRTAVKEGREMAIHPTTTTTPDELRQPTSINSSKSAAHAHRRTSAPGGRSPNPTSRNLSFRSSIRIPAGSIIRLN